MSSGTGQAFAGVNWVVDGIPEGVPITTSGWTATVDLSGENLDLVPSSITTFLGAAKSGSLGSAQATATNPVVTVTLEPNVVGFDDFTLSSYGGSQDATGTVSIEDGGATLRLGGNRWQKIDINYTGTTNTILEFDFRSDAEGDIHLNGFDTDLNISSQRAFKVYGTQNWGIQTYDTYSGGGVTQHFVITVGQHYTGVMPYLFFGMDHDVANPNGESVFSNVRISEN